jgi:hypothetical protein
MGSKLDRSSTPDVLTDRRFPRLPAAEYYEEVARLWRKPKPKVISDGDKTYFAFLVPSLADIQRVNADFCQTYFEAGNRDRHRALREAYCAGNTGKHSYHGQVCKFLRAAFMTAVELAIAKDKDLIGGYEEQEHIEQTQVAFAEKTRPRPGRSKRSKRLAKEFLNFYDQLRPTVKKYRALRRRAELTNTDFLEMAEIEQSIGKDILKDAVSLSLQPGGSREGPPPDLARVDWDRLSPADLTRQIMAVKGGHKYRASTIQQYV